MKIVVIGAAIGSQNFVENLLKKTKDTKNLEITMISKDSYPSYTRIFLPHYIGGEKTKEQLYLRNLDWYKTNKIELLLKTEVKKINPKEHTIEFTNNQTPMKYDKLVIAVGSTPRKMPYGNPNVKGVFALRTIADADEIKSYIKENKVKKIFIIGGGLLGIELGFHIKDLGIEITICEIFPYLLPKQLCETSSKYLKDYLETKGLKFILGQSVKKIVGDPKVQGIEMEFGLKFDTQMVLQQLGVSPNVDLAKNSGINTDKGIIVNEYMQTNQPDIYAIGDCIQFQNQCWGIIPATMDHAKIASSHIIGEKTAPYVPTQMQTKLKIAGLDLISIGSPNPINKDVAQILWKIDVKTNTCRKAIYEGKKLTGAILMGPNADINYFSQNMGKEVDTDQLKKKIED
jgi:nitrite reductase (NADH) large subunit